MVGRPQKYDWDDKRDICYKLYVEQKLSGGQIVKWFSNHFDIPVTELPNVSQFFKRFQQWGFPPRKEKISGEQEARIVLRMKELYAQNEQAKDILEKLNEEGYEIDEYSCRVLRKKHGLILRGQDNYKPLPLKGKKRKSAVVDDDEGRGEHEGEVHGEDVQVVKKVAKPVSGPSKRPTPPPLDPQEAARRAQRLADLQAESEQLLQTRKRRRRVRNYGHLPPDEPSEPRYKSETSLDECKAFLHLSNDMYNQIRAEFEVICRAEGIIKMTLCVEGQWQAAKDKLVQENTHLSAELHPFQEDLEKKNNALNCICYDVTKRIRTMSKTITIADANNILGLDPIQSKDLRRLYWDVLEADHFTTVVECGKDHLEDLRQRWREKSDLMQQVLAENDPDKMRSIALLERDARKRFQDDRSRKAPSEKSWSKSKSYGPGPGPANGVVRIKQGPLITAENKTPDGQALSSLKVPTPSGTVLTPSGSVSTESYAKASKHSIIPIGPAWIGHEVPAFHTTSIAQLVPPINFDIDPALEQMDRPRTGPIWPPTVSFDGDTREPDPISLSNGQPVNNPLASIPVASIPAYFRLSPMSTIVGQHPRMWLGKLTSRSVGALNEAATVKAGAANVTKVHGVVKSADGSEDSWLIENDDELEVYLGEAGEKATFVVVLEGWYA